MPAGAACSAPRIEASEPDRQLAPRPLQSHPGVGEQRLRRRPGDRRPRRAARRARPAPEQDRDQADRFAEPAAPVATPRRGRRSASPPRRSATSARTRCGQVRASGAPGPASTASASATAASQSPVASCEPPARAELPDPADGQVALDGQRQADAEQIARLREPPLLDVEVRQVAVAARVDLVEVVAGRGRGSPASLSRPSPGRSSPRRCRRSARSRTDSVGSPAPAASSPRCDQQRLRRRHVAGVQREVRLACASAWPSGLDLLGRRLAFGLEDLRGRGRRARRPRRRSRVVPVVHGERRGGSVLTPALSPARSPQLHRSAGWRRWRRRAGRSGSTPRRAPRAAPPRRPAVSGAPLSSASPEERGRLRVRARSGRGAAGVGGVAQDLPAGRRRRARGASARPGSAKPRAPRARRACGGAGARRRRAGGCRRSPGGTGRGGRRRRAARARISPAWSRARSAVKPMPSAGSR